MAVAGLHPAVLSKGIVNTVLVIPIPGSIAAHVRAELERVVTILGTEKQHGSCGASDIIIWCLCHVYEKMDLRKN